LGDSGAVVPFDSADQLVSREILSGTWLASIPAAEQKVVNKKFMLEKRSEGSFSIVWRIISAMAAGRQGL